MEKIKKSILLLILVQSAFCDECGTRQYSQPSIHGGSDAQIGQWPWFVRLFDRLRSPPFVKFFCGASLISDSHLLTAAHCVQNIESKKLKSESDILAMLGGLDISKLRDKRWTHRGISRIDVHPDFGRTVQQSISRHDADIAILTLAFPVEFNHLVNRVCLPPPTADVNNTYGTIVGHGLNEQEKLEDIPKYISVSSVPWQDCIFKNQYNRVLSSRGFCAGLPFKIPCKGDSGGGFYVFINNQWRVYGVVAAALFNNLGQCDATKQSVFTNVISFTSWIAQTSGITEVPSTKQCGLRKVRNRVKRIAGGRQSYLGEWPWFARLFKKKNSKFYCAATLISERHLLTAASCIVPKYSNSATKAEEVFAMLGGLDISNLQDQSLTRRDISKVETHPDWKTQAVDYDADIAVLTMSQAVQLSDFIQTVCLPSNSNPVFGIKGSIVGHGYDENISTAMDIPKTVEISSIDNGGCFLLDSDLARISSSRTFCAGSEDKGPCQGDSGGGFFVEEHGAWKISGIVSASLYAGASCSNVVPAVFTNVAVFVDWINQKITS